MCIFNKVFLGVGCFGPWAEPTVFATSDSGSVFALMGRINRVCNQCWKVGPVDLITFVISDLTFATCVL